MWFQGSIREAIDKSKSEKKVFLVYVEGNDDLSKKMSDVYNQLANELAQKQVVAIKLKSDSENCKLFSQLYPVIVVPSTYLIDNNGIPIEIVAGAVESDNFKSKVEDVLVKFCQSLSSEQQSSGSSSQPALATEDNSPVAQTEEPKADKAEKKTEEEAKTESSANIDEKMTRAKQLLDALREKKEKEESEKEKSDELKRRSEFKEMQKAKKLREEKEMEEAFKEREKEKREAKLARERVLKQIEADRAERRARQEAMTSSSVADVATSSPQPPAQTISSSNSQRPNQQQQQQSQLNETPKAKPSTSSRGPKAAYEKDGNVVRMRTKKDDDDENNTWNGNSTQQM